MAKNKAVKKITTPVGTLVGFISVLEPSTKFNPEGVYRAELLLPAAQGEDIANTILEVRTEQYKQYGAGSAVQPLTRCVPYTTINPATGEVVPDPEGRYILKTTAKAFVENGVAQNKIGVFDAACKPLKGIKIGEGTKAKLSISLEGYTVTIKHENDLTSTYSSLSSVIVNVGDKLTSNVKIGVSGTSVKDIDAGIHVHLTLMQNDEYINPKTAIGKEISEVSSIVK